MTKTIFSADQIKAQTRKVVGHPAWAYLGVDLREALISARALSWLAAQVCESLRPDDLSDTARRMREQAREWGELP